MLDGKGGPQWAYWVGPDVWSLYVTIIWTLDVDGFRRKSHEFTNYDEVLSAVLAASADNVVLYIRKMAMINPEERASAAQMLDKFFARAGRSAPQTDPATNIPAQPTPIGQGQTPASHQIHNVFSFNADHAMEF